MKRYFIALAGLPFYQVDWNLSLAAATTKAAELNSQSGRRAILVYLHCPNDPRALGELNHA